MSTGFLRRVATGLFAVFLIVTFRAHAQQPDVPFGYSSSRVIVKLTPGAHATLRACGELLGQVPMARLPAPMRERVLTWRATKVETLMATPFGDPVLASRLGLDRYFVVHVPTHTDTPAMVADFARLQPEIEEVGLDAIGTVAGTIPNDPDFSRQWAMHNTGVPDTGSPTDNCPDNVTWCADADIDAPEAWSTFTGSNNVTVAVIDSGVFPHVEFSSRMLTGFNTVTNTTDTSDTCPHGTHVAGIIVAGGNNGSTSCPEGQCGVVGVNWGANLLPVKVLPNCSGNTTDVVEGIIWAADHGARVLNMSLQFYNLSAASQTLFQNAIDYAYGLDCVIVAAAGNGNIGGPGVVAYPARFPNVLGVSATTACDEIATSANTGWNSNYGPEIDLSAPGDDIYSTWTNHTFRCVFGTSMATPHVSGVASLLRSFNPALSNSEVESILIASSDDLGAAGWDQFYGFGRVNAHQALVAGNPACETDADCDDGNVCDGIESCVSGFCAQGTPLFCSDGLYCNGAESCDPVEGCQPATPPNCGDGIDCTIDVCDEAQNTCSHTPDDTYCDDGAFCSGVETCDTVNGCEPAALPACDDNVDCTVDTCDESQDICLFTPDDSRCADVFFCNGAETCHQVNGCLAGTPVGCDDGVPCTLDACNEANDVCVVIPDDSSCDDGLFCNGNEVCDVMVGCVPDSNAVCDDNVPCTISLCDELTDTCAFIPDDEMCDDDVFCNGPEFCDTTGGCQLGTAPNCDDAIDCTLDLCDEGAGTCRHVSDHATCDDGDSCTVDVCDGGCGHTQVCGACCRRGGGCVELMTEAECNSSEPGVFLGIGTNCVGDADNDGFDDICPRFIPAVSEWGLVVLTLLLLTAAKAQGVRRATT